MSVEEYVALFAGLKFDPPERGKLLRHPQDVPRIYFNVKRDGGVSFAVRTADHAAFKRALWMVIEPQQKKDNDPNLMTLVPRDRLEREAFASIIGKG
jgi:hypothetical protein